MSGPLWRRAPQFRQGHDRTENVTATGRGPGTVTGRRRGTAPEPMGGQSAPEPEGQRITCGRKRAYSSVTGPADSRMPRPAASSPTTQAPSTTRLPSKSGSGANS